MSVRLAGCDLGFHRRRSGLEVADVLQGLFGAHRGHVAFAHVQQVGRADEQRVGAGQRQLGLLIGLPACHKLATQVIRMVMGIRISISWGE